MQDLTHELRVTVKIESIPPVTEISEQQFFKYCTEAMLSKAMTILAATAASTVTPHIVAYTWQTNLIRLETRTTSLVLLHS